MLRRSRPPIVEALRLCARLRVEPGDFESTGIATPATPFLGPVVRHGTGFVQRIELGGLLTPEVQTCLRAAREVA